VLVGMRGALGRPLPIASPGMLATGAIDAFPEGAAAWLPALLLGAAALGAALSTLRDRGRRAGGARATRARENPAVDAAERDAIDNPVEHLKLLSGDDDQIASYLDSLDVRSEREREMLWEISRTQPLAAPERFPADHRNMVEALESLSRHGFRGSRAGARLGPLRPVARWAVQLVARYLVVSHLRNLATTLRNLYTLREAEAVPGTEERRQLRRARMDAERMVGSLETRELGLPTFLIGGAALPVVAWLSRAAGAFGDPVWATVIGTVGLVFALAVSWVILRGAATASRRIRLATDPPAARLWESIGWCGRPPRGQVRTFVIAAVSLTLAAWIVFPVLVTIAVAA
jgi:hypothetical protein